MNETITPTAVLPPLPWFLGEPPTYPEAAPLLAAARVVIRQALLAGAHGHRNGRLLLVSWPATVPHAKAGLGIWWQDKLVLLATGDGEVWAYHAGSAWQEALGALATQTTAQVPAGHANDGQWVQSLAWSPYPPFLVALVTKDGVYDASGREYIAHGNYRIVPALSRGRDGARCEPAEGATP